MPLVMPMRPNASVARFSRARERNLKAYEEVFLLFTPPLCHCLSKRVHCKVDIALISVTKRLCSACGKLGPAKTKKEGTKIFE